MRKLLSLLLLICLVVLTGCSDYETYSECKVTMEIAMTDPLSGEEITMKSSVDVYDVKAKKDDKNWYVKDDDGQVETIPLSQMTCVK